MAHRARAESRCNRSPADAEALRGLVDVDLGFTPATNTLSLRRLAPAIGSSVDVTALWVRFPELTIEPLPQRYTRLSETRYRYESASGAFVAELEVDDLGLVVVYEGGWRRIAASSSPETVEDSPHPASPKGGSRMPDTPGDRPAEPFDVPATRRSAIGLTAGLALGDPSIGMAAAAAQHEGDAMPPVITHINPETMHQNPAFSQAVSVQGAAKTIYVGGQNAVAADGQIVGAGDLGAQTEQVLENIETVLAAAGAGRDDVIKWTIFVVQGQDINAGFAAFQRVWGPVARPPIISFALVAAPANPNFLAEIEVVAVTEVEHG